MALHTPPSITGIPEGQRSFPRDVSEFLTELAVAHNRLLSYPASHPAVAGCAAAVSAKLTNVLSERQTLTVAVTREGFVVDDISSESRHRLLASLARKLHDEQIAAAIFTQGVDEFEIRRLLETLLQGSSIAATPLGLGVAAEITWPHLRLVPVAYDKLRLSTGSDSLTGTLTGTSGEVRNLWKQLAAVAISGGDATAIGTDSAGNPDASDGPLPSPMEVAAALNASINSPATVSRTRATTGVLVRLVEQAGSSTRDMAAVSLQRYLSELIGTLSDETRERLMQMENDPTLRKKFLMAASEGLAADAVVALAKAAASASKVSISTPMLRMLEKMAATSAPGSEGEESVRVLVQQSAATWTTGVAGPTGEYTELLDHLSVATPDVASLRGRMSVNPLSVAALGLELGLVNTAVKTAADRVMIDGGVATMINALELEARHNSDAAAQLRAHVLRPAVLQLMLRSSTIDFASVQMFANATGVDAADPLLDLLTTTEDRAMRSRLLSLLTDMGSQVGQNAAARLRNAPWYVQRNLLDLLGRLPELPPGISLGEYARHHDSRVRRAAFKVILRDDARREEGLLLAFDDPEEDVVRLALGAALEDAPATVIPAVKRRYDRGDLTDEVRALCVKFLTARKDPAMLPKLLSLTLTPKRLFRKVRLAPKSAEMLAALSALATHWRDEARAVVALDYAMASTDAEVRNAVRTLQRGSPR